MDQDIREIESISFGVYSPTEILKMAVCKIGSNKRIGAGTVYDSRMGTTDNTTKCETCNETAEICPGHFGYIELNEPVIHPLYYKKVETYLKCFCSKCYRLLIVKDQVYIDGLNRFKGARRFEKISEKIEKVEICCQKDCENNQPDIKYGITDGNMYMIYVDKNKNKVSIVMTVDEIKKIFDNISDSDVELIGFDPKLIHPRNFILTVLPVIPPCDRPYVKQDGNICDDDLTNQYIEIIKANNHLAPTSEPISDVKRQKYIQSLKFRILTMFNNSKGKAKHTTNNRPIKGIKERITGKDGQIRNNLLGKRCDQSARTVIGPDPTLKMGQLAVPVDIADNLTVPVYVTEFNKNILTEIVNTGKAKFVIKNKKVRINLKKALFDKGTRLFRDDIIIRGDTKIKVISGTELLRQGDLLERAGTLVDNLKFPKHRTYELNIGDIVERKLQDGDIVLLNRQPTLHKASMQAMEVVIKPYKTLRFNLSTTKPFNADFDGDEMNIHVAQSLESQAELRYLSETKWNIISAQASKPNIAIVQDSLLGAYRMTYGIQKIRKDQFFDIVMKLENDVINDILKHIQRIRKVLKNKGKKIQCFNGMGLVSLLLPVDFTYEKRNGANPGEPVVKIHKGVMYEGTLDKTIIGASHNSIIQVLHKEYGPDRTALFVDGIQFVTNAWLLITGFSVGIKDCICVSSQEQEIQDVIQKCLVEAEIIKTTTTHANIRELRVNAVLGKAKDVGLRIAKQGFESDNNFISTVRSGSKGDFFNITQITGLLGQQSLRGARIKSEFSNGRRTLPHYPFDIPTVELEYESKGFISSSFIKGLNPKEFYFHAMSGREGVSDTALGTATSGYMQRKIVKLTEDIKIQYDGTVRDVTGRIYQNAYGEDGFDPIHTVKVGDTQEFCDVSRIVDKLNAKIC